MYGGCFVSIALLAPPEFVVVVFTLLAITTPTRVRQVLGMFNHSFFFFKAMRHHM